MNQPRKHHYVPQLYLKNFTLEGGEKDRLWVFDQEKLTQWASTPEGAAHQRDFYRIEDDQDPMAVERWFAQFESESAPVLREIIESRNLPPTESRAFGYFITFIALLIGRVPHIRETVSRFLDEVKRKMDFASREMGLEQDSFPNFDQTWHVDTILHNVTTLVPHLMLRKWSVWIVGDEAPDLVCSDNPVALAWKIPTPGPWPPGYGLPNTQITFPLNRRMMVVGSFEGQQDTCYLDAKDVATANSCTRRNAERLFSAEEDFVWLMRDGKIGRKADLIAAIESSKTLKTET
jgi:hypothetical protein